MQKMKLASQPVNPPQVGVEAPPWQRIYRFALAAWIFGLLSLALMASGLLSGCGGGGGGGGSSSSSDAVVNTLSQYVLPGEISAVPAKQEDEVSSASVTSQRTVKVGKFATSSFSTLAKAFSDAGTDYTKAKASKYVEEPALEQFSVLEDVLTALDQTRYYENIGQSAYKAMVTQVGGEDGQERKSLMAWVVESDIIDVDGNVVEPENAVSGRDYDVRVQAWIEEEGHIIKGQFVITDPPSQNEEGAYEDYGTWNLNVSFVDGGEEFFAASCSVNAQGQSVIKIHDREGPEGPGSADTMGFMAETKAIMYRSEDEGYGKVSFFDWEDFDWSIYSDPDFDPTTLDAADFTSTAKYAYNENYLALQEEGEPTTYKDRNEVVEMTHRYGVFRADNGDDVMRHKQFGFPLWYEENGVRKHGYYGAWQGRHQLWVDAEGGIPEGTLVTREDHGNDTTAETYRIGPTFDGTLTKRDYIDATLDDIKNIPVEIWVNKNFQLLYMYDASYGQDWYACKEINWDNYPTLSCNTTPIHFKTEIGYETLVVGENDTRKNVGINGWDNVNQTNKDYVFLGDSQTGNFYEAEWVDLTDDYGNTYQKLAAKSPLTAIETSNVTELWIWMGGSLYVEYKGETDGWVEKELTGFDEDRWMPEFGTNDKDYILPSNNELYINMEGATYVVRKDDSGAVSVKLELQTTLNPDNADDTDLLPANAILRDPWDTDGVNSTYRFITDPDDQRYLMLVYNTIGQNNLDQEQNPVDYEGNPISVGGVVETGMWGIEADNGAAFNWEYSEGGWGSVTYLMDNTQTEYVLLDDPIRFQPLEITHGSTPKTLGLQYDGWMMGLPDLYWELERNDWTMTEDIMNKIINLPAGTALESVDEVNYVLKPMEISQFLMPVDAGTSGLPDISAADDVNIDSVPDFEDHGMGTMPENTIVKYSEGIAIE